MCASPVLVLYFCVLMIECMYGRVMGACWGGARVGACLPPPPPPPGKSQTVFSLYEGHFYYFFSMWALWGPFCYSFLLIGCFFTMWGPFCYRFSLCGGLSVQFFSVYEVFYCAFPLPLRKFLRAPMGIVIVSPLLCSWIVMISACMS